MMRAIVQKEAAAVIVSHGEPMLYIPVVMPDGYLRVGCCGTCGDKPGSVMTHICTRTDCGLAHRHHTVGDAA